MGESTVNLINDPWIPTRRHDGSHATIAPWQITELHDQNPVMMIVTPRADFNGALMQFCIGLLQTTLEVDEDTWEEWLDTPPTPAVLRARFEPSAHAFDLDGDGPRFMQDLTLASEEAKDIAALLIEAPGDKSLRDNLDHFIKRGGVMGICPGCAAMALYTMQTNAPAGGVGHRTSLRGGGPLTTLALFDPKTATDEPGATLWRNVWLNVLDARSFLNLPGNPGKTLLSDTFPWLASTRTSESKTGRDTTPDDVHPAQMFWGMPRRIQLDFSTTQAGPCDLCGVASQTLITQYVTKNYGVNYTGPWLHPLSPYNFDKQGTPFARHAQPGGMSYRHWLGLVQDDGDSRKPAKVVALFKQRNRRAQCVLWAFGYDMDNMKARCWYESTMPLYQLDGESREDFEATVEKMIAAANEIRMYLVSALKQAWFERPGDARGDTSFIDQALWQNTESDFYAVLDMLANTLKADTDSFATMNQAKERWHSVLCRQALRLFDQWAASSAIEYENPRRIATAYNQLRRNLYGKKLRERILELPIKLQRDQGDTADVATV
jgi:CRISPR system Cascade subunit CasA